MTTQPAAQETRGVTHRAVQVCLALSWLTVRVVIARVLRRGGRTAPVGDRVARTLENLGGAFLKGGQFLSTRRDLVGNDIADALSRLQDSVRPMSTQDALGVLAVGRLGLDMRLRDGIMAGPVASGSIACVYRVRTPDGVLAMKVRRPAVSAQVTADTKIIRRIARLLSFVPVIRQVPVAEIADQLCACVVEQLDFAKERRNLDRFKTITRDIAGVTVPRPIPQMSNDSVLTMEFVDGLDRGGNARRSDAERAAAVRTLVRAVYKSLFLHGFVHVDLHQGNAYFLGGDQVAVIDFGFAYQMTEVAREKFTSFFAGMIDGDGAGCADTLLSTAQAVAFDADLAGFRQDVADLVVGNCGRSVGDFSLPRFAAGLFNLQRRYGIYAAPEFTFPLLSLLALEGTVNEHDPAMDFQLEAAPYVMASLLNPAADTG